MASGAARVSLASNSASFVRMSTGSPSTGEKREAFRERGLASVARSLGSPMPPLVLRLDQLPASLATQAGAIPSEKAISARLRDSSSICVGPHGGVSPRSTTTCEFRHAFRTRVLDIPSILAIVPYPRPLRLSSRASAKTSGAIGGRPTRRESFTGSPP